MLTNKGKYGLKAMVHLASLESGTTTMGAAIAQAENIPKKFLDAIPARPEAGMPGWCAARRGRAAAIRWPGRRRRSASATSSARWTAPAPIGCASQSCLCALPGRENREACEVRIVMTRVRDALSDILDRMTLEEMVAMAGRGTRT